MKPELFAPRNVIVQGITGTHGQFHTSAMRSRGTNVVAGTTPGKGGQVVDGLPVYDTIADLQQEHQVDASVVFVPARFAKSALFEAIDAKIPLIVCITEGIPVHDMLAVRRRLAGSSSVLVGPNCPGILVPEVAKLGIIPAQLGMPGPIGIVSRSGTLTYEIMAALTNANIGQAYVIGIGGDPVRGTGFDECLELFQADPRVEQIVLIGEIGGHDEHAAADYIATHVSKSVYAYVAGHSAPPNVQLGHAGAILGSEAESADSKTSALAAAGAVTADNIDNLVAKMVQ